MYQTMEVIHKRRSSTLSKQDHHEMLKLLQNRQQLTGPDTMQKTKDFNDALTKKLANLVTISNSPGYRKRKVERENLQTTMLQN